MHIKSLSIQGFKSYRDQVVIDPFRWGKGGQRERQHAALNVEG